MKTSTLIQATAREIGRRVEEDALREMQERFGPPNAPSPIELAFGCALYMHLKELLGPEIGVDISEMGLPNQNFDDFAWPPFRHIIAYPEMRVGQYRADFVIFIRDIDDMKFCAAIECDGHDFHQKTKSQVEKDRARDRYFQTRGLAVFRYPGSEIWRSPHLAAAQVIAECHAVMAAKAGLLA